MPDSQWNKVKEIFHAALKLPHGERASYLDRACDGDLALRKSVESLIKSHEDTNNFVDVPAYQAAAGMLLNRRQLHAGDTVRHYRVVSLLGEGGMGKVYLAEDTKLHRSVSIKFLLSDSADAEQTRRFVQEARAASALNHPNIVTIHEIGEDNGRPFIASEYIEGQTLRARLRSPIEIDELLDIAIQITSALVAAHRVNIVHRDIKPENIMIRKDDGLVKVLDFGLAKMTQRQPTRETAESAATTALIENTGPGVVIGTVAYMSPEQARGEAVDARTDIWTLGIVLYEMVTGCTPFVAGSSNEIISRILSRQPPAPMTRYSRVVPERLEEIVEKALTKDKDERYQTSKDLLIDLKRLKQSIETRAALDRSGPLDHEAVSTTTPTDGVLPAQTKQPTASSGNLVTQLKSHKRAAFVASALVLLLVTGVMFYAWRSRQAAAGTQAAISSIAVLPLANTNSDPETEFLSDGITDNIIERLAQIPDLRVMSHTAVFHYKGKEADPRTVGTELGVEAVLTGRLVKRNDVLTINVELVNAKDNSHIWGEQYDRKLSDLLAMQREIPLDVSDKLRLRLSRESKERLTRAQTENSEAYQLYLKARYAWETWTVEGSKRAIAYLEEAIKKDPSYALAYSGLADVYLFGTGVPEVSQEESHRRGREAAMKALSLDPQLGEAHAALSQVLLLDDWDFVGAERELKRALELNPNYAEGHHQYSHLLLYLGRINESYAESKRFLELDPLSEPPIGHLAYHYLYARQYDEAIKQFEKDLQLYPDSPQQFKFGDTYTQKGMYDKAMGHYLEGLKQQGVSKEKIVEFKAAFARSGIRGFYTEMLELLLAGPQNEWDKVSIAEIYSRLGEKDQTFAWLEKAYAEHSDQLIRLKEEVGFDNVRSDPRFADLLRRVGLPQ